MFTRHIWVRFGGKVGVEQMRCSGNYFELCHTHACADARRTAAVGLIFKFVIRFPFSFSSVFKLCVVE